MTPIHREWITSVMSGLDRRELATLLGLLGRLKDSVGRAVAEENAT